MDQIKSQAQNVQSFINLLADHCCKVRLKRFRKLITSLLIWVVVRDFYRPPTKLREGNIFIHVYVSVGLFKLVHLGPPQPAPWTCSLGPHHTGTPSSSWKVGGCPSTERPPCITYNHKAKYTMAFDKANQFVS